MANWEVHLHYNFIKQNVNIKIMNAEEFFRIQKDGKKMENEYFLAMEKDSFFRMMEEYANLKCKEQKVNNSLQVFEKRYNEYSVLEHN